MKLKKLLKSLKGLLPKFKKNVELDSPTLSASVESYLCKLEKESKNAIDGVSLALERASKAEARILEGMKKLDEVESKIIEEYSKLSDAKSKVSSEVKKLVREYKA